MVRRTKDKLCMLKKKEESTKLRRSMTKSTARDNTCHLLRLTDELLSIIYQYSLHGFTLDMEKVTSDESFLHPLMSTCKKIRMTMRQAHTEYLRAEASKLERKAQAVNRRITDNSDQANTAAQHRWRDFAEHSQLLWYEFDERQWEFHKVYRMAVELEEEADKEAWEAKKRDARNEGNL